MSVALAATGVQQYKNSHLGTIWPLNIWISLTMKSDLPVVKRFSPIAAMFQGESTDWWESHRIESSQLWELSLAANHTGVSAALAGYCRIAIATFDALCT